MGARRGPPSAAPEPAVGAAQEIWARPRAHQLAQRRDRRLQTQRSVKLAVSATASTARARGQSRPTGRLRTAKLCEHAMPVLPGRSRRRYLNSSRGEVAQPAPGTVDPSSELPLGIRRRRRRRRERGALFQSVMLRSVRVSSESPNRHHRPRPTRRSQTRSPRPHSRSPSPSLTESRRRRGSHRVVSVCPGAHVGHARRRAAPRPPASACERGVSDELGRSAGSMRAQRAHFSSRPRPGQAQQRRKVQMSSGAVGWVRVMCAQHGRVLYF